MESSFSAINVHTSVALFESFVILAEMTVHGGTIGDVVIGWERTIQH